MTAATDATARRARFVLATACLAIFVSTMDTTVATVAIPSIGRDLHASPSDLQWVLDSYIVIRGCLMFSAGALGDRFGRRTMFQQGLALFGIASLLCSLAPSADWLITFRIIQAVGGSFLVPTGFALIADAYPDRRGRAKAIGIWTAVTGISTGLGPVLGGALVDGFGWRSVFLINLPIVAVAIALAAKYAPARAGDPDRKLDPLGQLLVIVILVGLTSGCIEASQRGWSSTFVLTIFAIAVAALGAFLIVERRVEEPLLPLDLFKNAHFTGALMIATSAFAIYSGFLFVNVLYLQGIRHYEAWQAGLILIPTTIGNVVLSPASGRMTASRGPRLPIVIASVLFLAGALILTFSDETTSLVTLIVAYMSIGSAAGLINVPITTAPAASLPRSRAGVAGAVTSSFRQIGNSLGVALLGTLALSSLSSAAADSFIRHEGDGTAPPSAIVHAFVTGMHLSYAVASLLAVITLVIGIVAFRKPAAEEADLGELPLDRPIERV